jgi:hypothetical protein
MKMRNLLAATAAISLFATGAMAATGITSLTSYTGDSLHGGDTLITDFNSVGGTATGPGGAYLQGGAITDLAPGFTFTQDTLAYTRDGGAGLDSGVSAPPPLDNLVNGAYYETVKGGGSATLTSDRGLKSFSFYMGSPDDYNHIKFTFVGLGGATTTLNGTDIWGGTPPGNGDQTFGTTVRYTFGPDAVKSITFTSDTNAFEFDKLAGTAVPEPASWAMMIMGFGLAGGLLRANRRKQALA